jgi:hypothetical protein
MRRVAAETIAPPRRIKVASVALDNHSIEKELAMRLKQIAMTLSAVALSVSAVAANAVTPTPFYNNGDENDTSWLPTTKANKEAQPAQPAALEQANQKSFVRSGDENDTSWLPTPAKR